MLPVLSFATVMSNFDCALPMGVIGVLDNVYIYDAHSMLYLQVTPVALLSKMLQLMALNLALCNK
jgi:hypothetical protein